MVLFKDRAENYSAEELEAIFSRHPLVAEFIISEFLSSKRTLLYLLGGRGMGKTLTSLRVLRRELSRSPDFVPVVITFKKHGRLELLPSSRIATGSVWGNRLNILTTKIKEQLAVANCIVFDDIHYVLEAVEEGRISPSIPISLLNDMLLAAERGKKVILISDTMLSAYKDIVGIREFTILLRKFGEGTSRLKNPYVLKEMTGFEEELYWRLNEVYNINIGDFLKKYLGPGSPRGGIITSPRAFVRFFNLFENKIRAGKEISFDDVFKEAEKRFNKKQISALPYRRYLYKFMFLLQKYSPDYRFLEERYVPEDLEQKILNFKGTAENYSHGNYGFSLRAILKVKEELGLSNKKTVNCIRLIAAKNQYRQLLTTLFQKELAPD